MTFHCIIQLYKLGEGLTWVSHFCCLFFCFSFLITFGGLPAWLSGKEFTCQRRRHKTQETRVWSLCREDALVQKILCQSSPVFLPGKFHGQRSLAACSPWGCKELDMTERAHTHTHTHTQNHFLAVSTKSQNMRWLQTSKISNNSLFAALHF